ncbi:DUF2591 domain-containing protein [Pandoraea communis]|uniref:DUF2591 domain-containing protein n=1 Tax=Pandoraea communis TaxID=2508297 RepID=UPI0025A560A7|nr:DUF2591 domain-containing protein [Pandoraea communis]MDM8357517.1 DUF2591 domain-containing protein [Pandoraea communis]
MKVSELTGGLLDLWVACAEGEALTMHPPQNGRYWLKQGDYGSVKECPRYSTDWSHGGPIIERDLGTFSIERNGNGEACWYWADMGRTLSRYRLGGPTHLIAAMRAYVASKFGEEVSDAASQAAEERKS